MKKLMLIMVVVVAVAFIAWGVWFFVASRGSSSVAISSNPVGLLPPVQSQAQNGITVSVQGVSSPQDPRVANDFLGAIQNANQISLGGTVVVPPYALQIWGDTNKGGEALLKDTSSTGWTLVSLGGGEWSILSLIQEGVPVDAAEQLVAGLTNGTSTSATSSLNIPSGNTIAIGTSKGVVTMNNFYNSAAYIDQSEQTVVVQQTPTYGIFYSIPDSSFTIIIFEMPFEAARQIAEASFLTTLGISKGDACKLNIFIGAPYSIDPSAVDHNLGMSFCGGFGTL